MAIEANAAGGAQTIQPVQRPQATGSTESVARRSDSGSSSPFSPQTNVSIKNSIADMAGVLSKISTNQDEAVEAMPQQLQKVIQNVLQKTFSLSATLGEGLGGTVESQRFSLEQLTALSRMLSQLGAMAEKGVDVHDISDATQTLLQSFKTMLTAEKGGESLEPALLNKLSFQLLDTKTAQDLPAALQQLLGQLMGNTGVPVANTAASEGLQFLNQLVQYFMPAADTASTPQSKQSADASQTGQQQAGAENTSGSQQTRGTTTPSPMQQGESHGQTPASANMTMNAGRGTQPSAADMVRNTETQAMNTETNVNAKEENVQFGKSILAENAVGNKNSLPEEGTSALAGKQDGETVMSEQPAQQMVKESPVGSGKEMPQTGQKSVANGSSMENADLQMPGEQVANTESETTAGNRPNAAPAAQANTGGNTQAAMTARAGQSSLPLQNTPQLMDTMKELASLLLKDANLTEQDSALLQNFVNNGQKTLSETEAKQLQLLLRMSENNVPAAVKQAAQRQNMPELPRLWAFMQLCDMTTVKDMKARQLKSASRDIASFVSAMKESMGGENSSRMDAQGNVNRSLNFMVPIYLGGAEQPSYPAYLHVYDEEKQSEEQGTTQKETWLRLCVLTENIGAVELTCRLYEKQKLNVRVFFSNADAVDSFQEYIPEFRDSFRESPLELTDLKIGVAGTKL